MIRRKAFAFLFLGELLVLGVTCSGENPPEASKPPRAQHREANVKPLDHHTADLPKKPAIRFTKLFTLPQQNEGQGFYRVAFSPDGKILAASRWHGRATPDATLWHIGERRLLNVLPHPTGPNTPIAVGFLGAGDRLATICGGVNKIFVWEVRTGKLLDTLYPEGKATDLITGAGFPDGNRMIVCARRDLIVWDLEAKTKMTLSLEKHIPLAPGVKESVPRRCFGVAFTSDGSRFATTVPDFRFQRRILIWDAATCRVRAVIPVPSLDSYFAYAPDGSSVAAAVYTRYAGPNTKYYQPVGVWDTTTGKKLLFGEAFNAGQFTMVYTRDSKYLLIGGWETDPAHPWGISPSMGVWEVATGKLVSRIQDITASSHVAVSPDNKLLAVPYWGNIDIYAIESGGDRPRAQQQ